MNIRLTLIMLILIGASVQAASSVQIDMTINIVAIDAISISSSPPPFILRPKEVGDAYCRTIDQSTTYAIATNSCARSIYGCLNKNLPPEMMLQIQLAPPKGAVSLGAVPLTTANNRLVSAISHRAEGSLAITYVMTASSSMPPSIDQHILTYTIGP